MQEQPTPPKHRWGMIVDVDRCIGCQACVVACQAENNVMLNTEDTFTQLRVKEWIRIERYWVGEYPDIKARFLPVLCQQCTNAPCEPVCPVYATSHNEEGLNMQVYNRCVGTRFCGNNCPWQVRFFTFNDPDWPDPLTNQLNPDVTVRSKGIMEKCSYCIQRIRKAEMKARGEGRELRDMEFQTACAQACPPSALIFGDLNDPNSKVARLQGDRRRYLLLGELGTEPNTIYLKKVDPYPPVQQG
ncbi:MAG TPA: 4Fe-4S dicluster domain-containing protein [Chloroflexota bacterium]|nr:4Fe-4S dicluster domain-containing protein [Chloroflexota bacterium]